MRPTEVVLGLDTSAYTTSAALVGKDRWVRHARRLLPVADGARGLKPSEAVFRHLEQLPSVLGDVWHREPLIAIAVSVKPRPTVDSYLPSFRAGETVARVMAHAFNVPLIATTHQEGHLAAGILDAQGPAAKTFWALHISGGTTELLDVTRQDGDFRIETVGHTADLYAGQLVDRIGVRLGLRFPAGTALEQLSATARDRLSLPVGPPFQRDGRWCISFSGPEAQALRAIASGSEPAAVARGVEDVLVRGLSALIRAAAIPPRPLLVVGGVAANQRLRAGLKDRLGTDYPLYWASPALSRDNAVGIATIGWWQVTGPSGQTSEQGSVVGDGQS